MAAGAGVGIEVGQRLVGGDLDLHEPDPVGGPVLLVTLDVPLDEASAVFTVDVAIESGQALTVANITRLEPLGRGETGMGITHTCCVECGPG